MERTNYVIQYSHKGKPLGDISRIKEVINHPVTGGMAQHVVHFWGNTQRSGGNPREFVNVFSWQNHQLPFARGWTVCLIGLQSWGLWLWNRPALSANCLWVAFKFIDSLGDIVLLLCPQPIVNNINCCSCFPAVVLHGWLGAREQCGAQQECPLRGQETRPLQVPLLFA